jgi:methylene-fatty-acyl-phospholipid synthase
LNAQLEALVAAAVLLSLERIAYVVVWRAPDAFRAACARSTIAAFDHPVDALEALFLLFKAIQIGVFVWWCWVFGPQPPALPDGRIVPTALGTLLVIAGQGLNLTVFYRLGRDGVFYGNRFGRPVPWCRAFPFSVFEHPQYVGTLLSIWGFFLVMRFPADDWLALPVVETVYYAAGARAER